MESPGCAAARVVGTVGENDRAFRTGECFVQGLVDAAIRHQQLFAHGDKFVGKLARDVLRGLRIAVAVDQYAGAHFGYVARCEAVSDRHGKNAVLAFQRLHPLDEALARFARGVHGHDHAGVDEGGDRPDAFVVFGDAQVDEFFGPLDDVRMRVFLEQHEHVGAVHHLMRQVGVQVEFATNGRIRAYDIAHAGQDVAFAIDVAVCHHRAMQAQQDHVDRHGALQIAEQFVAQRLVGGAGRDAAGRRGSDHAFADVPPEFLARRRAMQRGAP